MAYDIGRLRQQNLMGGYDELTPGARGGGGMNYSDNYSLGSEPEAQSSPGLQAVGNQGYSLGSEPEVQREQGPIQTPTVEPVAAPRVDPYAGTSFRDMLNQMNEGFTPATTSRDRLDALLNEAPERKAPGWGRALVAAAMSVKAQDPIATAEKVMYAPYMRDVEEWKTRADPYYKAAELENRANINERTIVSNAATAYNTAERNRIQDQKNRDAAESSRIRANAYAYSQRLGKGWDWDLTGPTAKKMNKTTGEIIDTGLDTGKMDEQTKIELQNEGKVEAAREMAAAAAGRTNAAGSEFYQAPSGEIVAGNPRTGQAPPTGSTRVPSGGTGAGATSQLEKHRVEQEIMKQQRTTDPGARDYMKPDGKGGYTWADRPVEGSTVGGWLGNRIGGTTVTKEDVEKYDAYRLEANPEYKPRIKGIGTSKVPSPTVTPPGTSNKIPTSKPPPQPTRAQQEQIESVKSGQRIIVTDKNGRRATILNTPEEIAAAKAAGFKVGG